MDALTRRQFDRAMFAKERTLAIRVGDYASRDIKEASFEYGYIKGDTYKPGGTCAGSGKVTFTSIITTFNKLDILHPEIGLLVGDTYQWVKMGEYFINDIEIDRNRNTTTLELIDGMFKLNREYVTDLHFPAEVREVIQEICLKTGIELANDYFGISAMRYHVEQVPEGKKLSFRDMLSAMTQMIGMSCFFNREGKMEIRDLNESNITINADSYFLHGLTKSEIEYQIAGITCKTDKKSLTVGMKTGRSLELDNVFMTQSALNDLYYKLKNLTYYPYNLNYQGHLLLEVGQWVTIQTNKKETFKVPVLSQSFTFKGGLRGRISADSKAGNDTQYSYEGTITKQIKQQDGIEAKIQAQIEAADTAFDAEFKKRKKEIDDGIELAKAKAEEVKQELSDTINQRFDSFDNGPFKETKRKAEEALKNAGASSLLAQEAKQIGLDSIARLEAFKSQTTNAQTALSGDLDGLKQKVTSEVNQASEYRRMTTEALSRMTGQMNGFATKSEVKQGIDGLTQTFAKLKVGSRNYAEDYDFSRGLWHYSQGDNSPQDWTISNGEYNVKGTTNTWKQMQIYSKEGSHALGKKSTALLDLEVGETYTLSFQGICYSGSSSVWLSLRANRTAPSNPEIMYGNFNLTSSWQTYQVTIPALTKPENFDFWRIILGYNEIGHVAFRKVELTRSSTRIDAGPAPEDGKTDLVVAKTEFQKTADGLSAKMSAIESYVGQDSQRQEALRIYTREESARQAIAVRELVTKDYVGKATYQETVRAIENKFEDITNPQNGSIVTQIANYKKSVDGRFADITSMIAGKANQSDFQRVKETSQLYERILGGSGSSDQTVKDNIARLVMTNQLFQTEVGRYSGNGVNRAMNTTSDWGPFISRSGGNGVNLHADLHKILSSGFKAGDTVHVRMEISIDDVQRFNDKQIVAILQSYGDVTNWARAGRTFDYNIGTLQPGNNWRLIEFDTVMTEEMLRNNSWMLNLRIDGASSYKVHTKAVKVEKGNVASAWSAAPEDIDEAVRSVQSQLAGSWAVQNINSAGSIVSQINATNNQILVEAEKIRFKGKTLADQLTAIDGYFKRLFVGEGNFATLNTEVLKSNSITADKLVMDMAMARLFVSSDIFTNTLASKTAFINKLQSVIVSSTLLEGYKGWIGGFQIGTHDSGSGRWLTGRNHFSVGMGDGEGGSGQTALWVNWGGNWSAPGYYAWFVKNNGKMYCYNTAEFWNTPIVNGDLKVTGNIIYDGGAWIYSSQYVKIGRSSTYYFYLEKASGERDYFLVSNDTSDRRLKSNIQESDVSGIDVINRLKTYSYRKEFNNEVEDISCGIMAQDVQKYAPDAFRESPDGVYTYNTFALVPYLIKAIQELNQKIEKMEKTIA